MPRIKFYNTETKAWEYADKSTGSSGNVDLPEKLPNPYALTLTGAVNATYDGSKEVNVLIPSGGSSDGDTSTMQEIVLASGTIPTGTAKWFKTDTGLKASDLQNWKILGFRLIGTTSSNALMIGNTTKLQSSDKKNQIIFGWLDSERKAIDIIATSFGNGYTVIGKPMLSNGYSIQTTNMAPSAYIPFIVNNTDNVYIYNHDELTSDLQWEIRGLIK